MIISDSCGFFSGLNEKKSGCNSSMRLEKEESQLCTLVAWKANYFLQDYHMYARTRNRSNITRVVIISDFLRKRFLWKQDPENCKPQRDNRLKVGESISKVALSSILHLMKVVKIFHLSINNNEQYIFVLSKNTAKLTNHEINPEVFFFSKLFKQGKEKLKILRPTWLSPSGFCVQNIVSLLSTFADSNFYDFCGFLSVPLKSYRK